MSIYADGRGHIFGPVRSGRLGASLGLDLLGAKICSFDCLYCEVGQTLALTASRKPYVPTGKILTELAGWLSGPHPAFDVVTLGGMGEPTLNSDLGAIIEGVRSLVPDAPVAVLTNSSVLRDPLVRTELALADIVLPSLDTLVPVEFARLNRPMTGVTLVDIRRGLLEFRALYPGRLYLEVLLLSGVNDSEENLARLGDFCRELCADRVDVVTMTRPGAYPEALPAPSATLERFRRALNPSGSGARKPEVPEKARHFASPQTGRPLDNAPSEGLDTLRIRILDSLSRRPQTAASLAESLSVPERALTNLLNDLVRCELVKPSRFGDETFYMRNAS